MHSRNNKTMARQKKPFLGMAVLSMAVSLCIIFIFLDSAYLTQTHFMSHFPAFSDDDRSPVSPLLFFVSVKIQMRFWGCLVSQNLPVVFHAIGFLVVCQSFDRVTVINYALA